MRSSLLACALCLILVACMDRPAKYRYTPPPPQTQQYTPQQQYSSQPPQPRYRDNDEEYILLMDPYYQNMQQY